MSEADDPLTQVRAVCLRYLARREYSRAELLQKLSAKGHDDTVVGEVLRELAEQGLQSDRRFLEAFVRGQVVKGRGANRIRREPRLQGTSRDCVETVLGEYDWDDLLAKAYAKKYRGGVPGSPREYAARAGFLSRRGFDPERIQALFRQLRRDGE